MDFVNVSQAFFGWEEDLTVLRAAEGSYANGLWSGGSPSETTIRAHVQNANPRDLQVLPEGLRTTESIKIFSKTLFKTVEEAGQTNADTVQYEGFNWLVHSVARRTIGGYFKSIAVRKSPIVVVPEGGGPV